MIEIIALIFLARQIGHMAVERGLPKGKWQFAMVLAWFLFEIPGLIIGMNIIGAQGLTTEGGIVNMDMRDMLTLTGIGLMTALGGYLLVRYRLEQHPVKKNED